MNNKDIIIENIPLADQSSAADPFWKIRSCGIATIKMLLEFTYPNKPPLSLDKLIAEGLVQGAYMDNIGWRHAGLVELANQYGLALDYQKLFYKTDTEKLTGSEFIEINIKAGKPIIASVHRDFIIENEGHLVIVRGLSEEDGQVAGYYIQDPDGRVLGNFYLVTKKDFLTAWRGGLIWIK